MFRALAALAVASASTSAPPATTLTSSAPWWERVTVTVSDDGNTRSCRYESSLKPRNATDCSVVSSGASTAKSAASSGAKDQYTRITFERRFSPGAKPNMDALQPGETLLGGQMLALAIDPRGAVKGCKVVQRSGSLPPQYGCDEAAAEHFEASATNIHTAAPTREGYMTVIVYGHSEHVV
nr:hypothetical protein [Sphingomonas sp.]